MPVESDSLFTDRFGKDPRITTHAPGRVNLIGEHTDYNNGFVFPAAIDRGVTVEAEATPGTTRLFSTALSDAEPFDTRIVAPGELKGWAKYPAAVAWSLREFGELPNLNGTVTSDLPLGSGLSSSAAIEMAFAILWNELAGLGLSNRDLALRCQKAENEFVGMNCGIMDQMASAMGREGQAMFLDTKSLEIAYSPIPEGLSIVVCDTGKQRSLTSSAYNGRRAQFEEACRLLGVASLRDATLGALEQNKARLGDVVFRRALHVVTENQRCVKFAEALRSRDFYQVGRLMAGSHESLRNNYEVSCIELDSMVLNTFGVKGCIGVRMTGAGFGGACVALVETAEVEAFLSEANVKYRAANPAYQPTFLVCQASEGAHVLQTMNRTDEFSQISGQTISKQTEDVERL